MTHDPRLATLEQVMNASSPFELVDTPIGKMEKWRAETLLIGSTSGIQDVYHAIRADAAAQEARANADKAQHALLRRFFSTVGKFLDGVGHVVSRVEAAEEKRRADARAEQAAREFEEEPLTLPPDLAERQTSAPPTKIEDDTNQPGGELHAVPAKEDPEDTPPPPEELDEPFAGDDMGDVPMCSVRGSMRIP